MSERQIVRMWTGQVPTERAAEYEALMVSVALPHYKSTEGNLGAWCLRRELGDGLTEFRMLTIWSSLEAVKAFAGERYDEAVYYDFDEEFLVSKARFVDHFDVADGAS